MIATTTLNKIRQKRPCSDGWIKLLAHLGKTKADDDPVTLRTVLDSNGLDDALWCLRASDAPEFEMRRFARLAALDVAHLWKMPAIVREYLKTGDETKLDDARGAWVAEWDAMGAWAAAMAARDATWAAAAALDTRAVWAEWAARAAARDARAAWAAAVKIQSERFIEMFCTEEQP